jgi:hypothetical protein
MTEGPSPPIADWVEHLDARAQCEGDYMTNKEFREMTTFAFSGDRAVRLTVNLYCPRWTELKASDVGSQPAIETSSQ